MFPAPSSECWPMRRPDNGRRALTRVNFPGRILFSFTNKSCKRAVEIARSLTCEVDSVPSRGMNRQLRLLALVALALMMFPSRALAPLYYTPGEGWSYEAVGGAGA